MRVKVEIGERSEDSSGWSQIETDLLKHYSDNFIYQAGQRLNTFRFAIPTLALAAGAIGTVLLSNPGANSVLGTDEQRMIALGLCILLYLVVLILARLDHRNALLVECVERPLEILQRKSSVAMKGRLEKKITKQFGPERVCLERFWSFENNEVLGTWHTKYKWLIPSFYLVFALGAVAVIWWLIGKIPTRFAADASMREVVRCGFSLALGILAAMAAFWPTAKFRFLRRRRRKNMLKTRRRMRGK